MAHRGTPEQVRVPSAGRHAITIRTRAAGHLVALVVLVVALVATSTGAGAPDAAAGVDTTPPPTPANLAAADSQADPQLVDVLMDGEADLGGATSSAAATLDADAARFGQSGVRVSATAEPGHVRWQDAAVPAGNPFASARFWVRVNGQGAGESVDLFTIANAENSQNFDFFVTATTRRFKWDIFSADVDESDFAVTYGRWYLVEVTLDFEGATHRARVRIDGEDQGTISSSGVNTTVAGISVGSFTAKTHDQDYDNLAVDLDTTAPGWVPSPEDGFATVTLTWDPVVDDSSGVQWYEIERDGRFLGRVPAPTTTLVDPLPVPGGRYRVRAQDQAGNLSAWSDEVGVPAPCDGSPFADVPPWLTAAVDWAFCAGHVAGYPDGTFQPDRWISRGEFGRFQYRVAGSPDVTGLPDHGLGDVPPWLEDAVTWLVAAGHMTGYPDGTFRAGLPISRAQIVRAGHRIAGAPVGAPPHPFTDVPAWVADAVSWATWDPDGAGPEVALMTGYPGGHFLPELPTTRGQTVRFTCRANAPTGTC